MRETDPARVARLMGKDANEEAVRAFMAHPLSVVLTEGEGGAMFAWRGPGIYEVHVFFEQRGRAVLDLSHKMLAWMRRERNAQMFWSVIPIKSRHVIMFTRMMGWKSKGVIDAPEGQLEIFSTEYEPCPQL